MNKMVFYFVYSFFSFIHFFFIRLQSSHFKTNKQTNQMGEKHEGELSHITRSQVSLHNSSKTCWVVIENKVYDVTSFISDHPGGEELIVEYAGTDITSVLQDDDLHTHSDAAYDILSEYYIGQVESQDETNQSKPTQDKKVENNRDNKFLVLRKPLFSQLWNATYSKAFYLEQVHRPRYTPYYVPYFENPLLDKLSRTSWYIVPTIWLPFVTFQLWRSLNAVNSSAETTAQGFIIGILFWTLFEYTLHRFLFHLDDLLPDHPSALLIHFTLHGIHHHMPMDR
jgi:4-hydroxysphinganine ceramide fatty acyl 2-hydroxylase